MKSEMKTYQLRMFTELYRGFIWDVDIQAENDEEAIDKADTESDKYPVLICMDLYREDGSRVKHWGK